MIDKIFFAGYMYALAGGFFGAAFFMIVDLQKSVLDSTVDSLRDMWTYRMILLRCSFGVGASAILYFFFQTSLLGDGAWPEVSKIGFSPTQSHWRGMPFGGSEFKFPNKDTALLIIWSFLAGYSQTFVPKYLARTTDDVE